jgi:hypothetical protein
MALEYGLLASMSSILSDVLWQLREVWNFLPWWALVALAVAVIITVRYLLFRR